jgi:DNA-binding response OmpR family regulator
VRERVLLVDRGAEAAILRAALERAGFEVIGAHDLGSALLAFEASRPTAALIALDRPEAEGGQLFTALRGRDDSQGFPVVLIDSQPAGGAERRRTSVPFSATEPLLMRPLDPEDAVAELRRSIAQARPSAQPTQVTLAPEAPLEDQVAEAEEAAFEAAAAALDEHVARADALHREQRPPPTAARTAPTETGAPPFDAARLCALLGGLLARWEDLEGRLSAPDPERARGIDPNAPRFLRALGGGVPVELAAQQAGLDLSFARAIALWSLEQGWLIPAAAPVFSEEALLEWWHAHRDRDYFTMLGVSIDAPVEAIPPAHRRVRQALGLERAGGSPLASTVRRTLEDAVAVLSNPRLLEAYRAGLDRRG